MGFAIWSEAVTAARDRKSWRRQVNGPILSEETGNKEEEELMTLDTLLKAFFTYYFVTVSYLTSSQID